MAKRLRVEYLTDRKPEYVKADVYVTDGQLLHFHDIGGGKQLPVLTINQSIIARIEEQDVNTKKPRDEE